MRIKDKMAIGGAAAAFQKWNQRMRIGVRADSCAALCSQKAGSGCRDRRCVFTAVGDRQFAFIYNKHLADVR